MSIINLVGVALKVEQLEGGTVLKSECLDVEREGGRDCCLDGVVFMQY